MREDLCAHKAVYSKMISIPEKSNPIEVESSFGGLAIYKRELFFNKRYHGLDKDGIEVCEHVEMHEKMKKMVPNFLSIQN